MIPASPSILRPTSARYGVLAFACSLSLITYLDRICISRARPDVKGALGLDDTQIGWVFGAFSLGYMLFEVPGGWMGDAWGSRRVLTRIVVCWSIFTALTGLVWRWEVGGVVLGFYALVLIRFLFGAGEAGAYPNLTRVTADWFPLRHRANALSAIWWAARLGGAFAPLVLGRLSVLLGWRSAFLILGALGVVWGWLFWRWFRDRPEQHPSCNDAERRLIEAGSPPREGHGHPTPGWADLRPALLTAIAACWASFWVCMGWYFYPTWQPKYLEEVQGMAPTGVPLELLTGLPFLCGSFGSLGSGPLSEWLVRRFGRRWGRSLLGVGGFTGAGLCVLATGFVPGGSAWLAVTLLCLAFLINDLAIPVMWATCADVGGRFAGSLSGAMNMVGAAAAVLCPVLLPYADKWLMSLFDDAGLRWRVIFAGLAVSWFLAAAAWPFIDASKRMGRPAPAPLDAGPSQGREEEVIGAREEGIVAAESGIRPEVPVNLNRGG